MKSKSVAKTKDMGVVKYIINNVAGDGHCFYRALFQILQDVDNESKSIMNIDAIEDEDDGVRNIRTFVANGIKSRKYVDTLTTIDTLCDLIANADPSDRTVLSDQLTEMYPFVNDAVCGKKGVRRYKLVADMVSDMSEPMYASSMEIDQVKLALSKTDLSLLTISANGNIRTAEKKFTHDLGKLLENTSTKYVAVLLNRNNVHYQYLTFKARDDEQYRAVVNRAHLLRLIRMTDAVGDDEKIALMSGGKKSARK